MYIIRPGKTDPVQTNVEVVAMTQEKETIDGKSDFWLKIKYKDYEGWIFGGYASIERGVPKYYIPENIVIFDFFWIWVLILPLIRLQNRFSGLKATLTQVHGLFFYVFVGLRFGHLQVLD